MTTLTAAERAPRRIKVYGHYIRARFIQQLAWGLIVGAFFAAIIAGFYFGLLEVRWFIHIGSFNRQIFYLKHWWDHLIKRPSWPLYRHAFRDLGEPAAAVMGVKTVFAARKYWGVRVGTARLVLTPPLLILVAGGLIAGGTWLVDFGIPQLWHHFGWATYQGWHGIWTEAGKFSVITLALGFGIGFILHHIWGPVVATIQGDLLDRSVDKADGRPPLWVRWPLMAPVTRERWWWMYTHNTEVTERKPIPWGIIVTIVVVAVLLAALGVVGHFVVGAAGMSVPYLAP